MRSCICAAVALFLFFIHPSAQAQEKMKWQFIATTHFTLEVSEPEVTISVMEFGSHVVVMWKWPCKSASGTSSIMQRSDKQLRRSGKCLTDNASVTYDRLLIALRAVARESEPPTDLLNMLTKLPHWSEVE